MQSRVSIGFAAVSAISALTGCVEESLGPPPTVPAPYRALATAQLQTVGAPGPQDQAFGEALTEYAREVHRIHAFEGARAEAQITWSVLRLAALLERMPVAAAEPRMRRAAEQIRRTEAGTGTDDAEPLEPWAERTRRSLAIAATALLQLAKSHYADTPEIAAEARVFAAIVETIDPESDSTDRAGMIDALIRSTRLLARMYAINVAPASSATP
jgi:hypothetical protein